MNNKSPLEEFLLSSDDFRLVLLPYLCDAIFIDKLRPERIAALQTLSGFLTRLKDENIHGALLTKIAHEKAESILKAQTKGEIQELLHPKPPHYNGGRFISSPSLTDGEELLAWIKVSMNVALDSNAVHRIATLMHKIFPDYDAKK